MTKQKIVVDGVGYFSEERLNAERDLGYQDGFADGEQTSHSFNEGFDAGVKYNEGILAPCEDVSIISVKPNYLTIGDVVEIGLVSKGTMPGKMPVTKFFPGQRLRIKVL